MVPPAWSGSLQGDICKSEELCSSHPDRTPQGSLSLCTVQAGGLADKAWELRPPKSPSLPLTSLASGPASLGPGPPGLSAQLSPAWDTPVRAGFSVGWPGVIVVAECRHYGGALRRAPLQVPRRAGFSCWKGRTCCASRWPPLCLSSWFSAPGNGWHLVPWGRRSFSFLLCRVLGQLRGLSSAPERRPSACPTGQRDPFCSSLGLPAGAPCWGRVSLALPGYKAGTPPWTRNRTTASSSTFPDVKPYVKICRRSKIQLHLITQSGAASDPTWTTLGDPGAWPGVGCVLSPWPAGPGLSWHVTVPSPALTRFCLMQFVFTCGFTRAHACPGGGGRRSA